MIHVESVTKKFSSGTEALCGVSFEVGAGEVVGLLGGNGAGKTTCFRILSGLVRPTSGRCLVCGSDVQAETLRARQVSGFLPGSDSGLYDRLTALENIMYYARLYGMDRDYAMQRVSYLSSLLDMQGFMNRRTAEFSRGMKQRAAIARAFIHDPDVVLLDEPSTGLDAASAAAIHRLIADSAASGKAVLLSSHNVHEINKMCGRVLILQRGLIVESGTITSIEERHSMDFESVFLKFTGNAL
jgi:sodium transport system ATP-binding protein